LSKNERAHFIEINGIGSCIANTSNVKYRQKHEVEIEMQNSTFMMTLFPNNDFKKAFIFAINACVFVQHQLQKHKIKAHLSKTP